MPQMLTVPDHLAQMLTVPVHVLQTLTVPVYVHGSLAGTASNRWHQHQSSTAGLHSNLDTFAWRFPREKVAAPRGRLGMPEMPI